MTKLTAIIPTFNEESNIQRALDSVDFADEIIVIDSYSTDKTIEIIQKKGNVRLLQRKFDNFSSQKNYAISKATYQWIFLLDADEAISDRLKKEIVTKITGNNEFDSYNVYRSFFIKGKKIRFSGLQGDKVVRLFKKDKCHYQGLVHEKMITDGKVGKLKNTLNHYSYKSHEHYTGKLKLYAKLQAKELHEKGVKASLIKLIVKPTARFIIQFIIKLGFLDGVYGLYISYLHAQGVWLRYKELYKLEQSQD